MVEQTRIAVAAERPYNVLVGHDLLGNLPGLLGGGVQRVALIHPPTLTGGAACPRDNPASANPPNPKDPRP